MLLDYTQCSSSSEGRLAHTFRSPGLQILRPGCGGLLEHVYCSSQTRHPGDRQCDGCEMCVSSSSNVLPRKAFGSVFNFKPPSNPNMGRPMVINQEEPSHYRMVGKACRETIRLDTRVIPMTLPHTRAFPASFTSGAPPLDAPPSLRNAWAAGTDHSRSTSGHINAVRACVAIRDLRKPCGPSSSKAAYNWSPPAQSPEAKIPPPRPRSLTITPDTSTAASTSIDAARQLHWRFGRHRR